MAAAPTSNPEPPPFDLTDVDRDVLSQTDEEFALHDWDNLKDIIGCAVSLEICIHPSPLTYPLRKSNSTQ